jgi:hypothetical protein
MKKLALIVGALVLAGSPLFGDVRIDVKGGGVYWAKKAPAARGATYVFTDLHGTVMSLRKSDVVAIHAGTSPTLATKAEPIGYVSPVSAARAQQKINEKAAAAPPTHAFGQKEESDLDSQAFRPGVGLALPAAPGDYEVGRTIAPPASGAVTSGSAPMLEEKPPPPPHR